MVGQVVNLRRIGNPPVEACTRPWAGGSILPHKSPVERLLFDLPKRALPNWVAIRTPGFAANFPVMTCLMPLAEVTPRSIRPPPLPILICDSPVSPQYCSEEHTSEL